MGHPNTRKHKAMHCGYKGRPSERDVTALLVMYAGICNSPKQSYKKSALGVQLRLDL